MQSSTAKLGEIANSTYGWNTISLTPRMPMMRNHTAITGPKMRPTL